MSARTGILACVDTRSGFVLAADEHSEGPHPPERVDEDERPTLRPTSMSRTDLVVIGLPTR